MLRNLTCLLLFIPLLNVAQIPPGYYYSAYYIYGESKRQALHDIIDDHTQINYSNLWSQFTTTDEDDNNANLVYDIYSYSSSGSSYTYTFGTNQCGNYNSEGDCYNREHTVPKSWFNDAMPMYSDLFHVYPTDGYVNGLRSNYSYGETNNPSNSTTNGSLIGPCSYPGCSGTIFEPSDEFKGDLARTYFYMATRYMDVCASWTGDMFSGNNLSAWAEDMLMDWHLQDPVSAKEIERNNDIYGIQGNRNPYIDHPEWVEQIWGDNVSLNEEETSTSLSYSNQQILIDCEFDCTGELLIFDMMGRQISQTPVNNTSAGIAVDLSEGIYIARFIGSKSSVSLKFKI